MASRNWLVILCIGAVGLFIARTLYCFADQVGLVSCCRSVDSERHHDPSNPDLPNGNSGCVAHCGAEAMAVELPINLPTASSVVGTIFHRVDTAPEDPVRTIDYPPQLS
ncbi:MAG TPA: hypothetical protein VIS96_00645 [Terrimicrobiaceae bacterium]